MVNEYGTTLEEVMENILREKPWTTVIPISEAWWTGKGIISFAYEGKIYSEIDPIWIFENGDPKQSIGIAPVDPVPVEGNRFLCHHQKTFVFTGANILEASVADVVSRLRSNGKSATSLAIVCNLDDEIIVRYKGNEYRGLTADWQSFAIPAVGVVEVGDMTFVFNTETLIPVVENPSIEIRGRSYGMTTRGIFPAQEAAVVQQVRFLLNK